MSDKLRRIVLTGGPGSGKSTLIEVLHRRGYPHSQEAGRAIIQEQVSIGGNALPWGDRQAFAERMLDWELRSWREATGATCGFFDRGLPDIAGYLTLCGLPIPAPLTAAIGAFRYADTVFIAPPWRAIYAQDSERKQSFAEAEQTYRAMLAVYRQHRYQLQELPRASPDERADFLLDALGCR
ncbi:ATPase [Serratia marcescens]|uniref:AAA family ATPase n=1 Tax=Serratia marcescens TaxID=615 RepID=UPI000CDD86FF|nr:AAA family ATPase [Serratia marcescens]POW96853.1 ATPase [Serratia marcescens]POX01465.1 ATPase [Serratia marcescens]POX15690.1 ATPase [Serratia marcescens]